MKKALKRIGLTLLGIIAFLLVGVLLQSVKPNQPLVWREGTPITPHFDSAYYVNHIDSLKTIFGNKKGLPKGYEAQALLALSVYPELKDVAVDFVFTPKVNAPLEANFAIPTLFLPKRNRKYRVRISSTNTGFMSKANFRNINFNGQVGILAHELGHVVYYDQLNTFQIGRWGLNYLMKKGFADTHERETDKLVIFRGLGWQLWESTLFFSQYFGNYERGGEAEMLDKVMTATEKMPTTESGRYLDLQPLLNEMGNIAAYQKSFEEVRRGM